MHATAGQPDIAVSTSGVPLSKRVSFWEEWNCSVLVGLRCTTYAADGLQASLRRSDFDGGFRISEIAGNEHVIERPKELLARYPRDSVFACLLLKGRGFIYQGEDCINLTAGDIVFYDTNRPYLYGFPVPMHQLLFDIPGSLFRKHCGDWRHKTAIRIDGRLGTGRFASAMLRAKAAALRTQDQDARRTGAADILDTLLTTYGVKENRPGASQSAELLVLSARSFIQENLAKPGLDAAAVAAAVGISVRHLNRVFQTQETTVTELIWKQRLERAQADLENPVHRKLTVAEIAFRWGFNSEAHFCRAYKKQFGLTPTASRRLRLVGPA